MLNGKDQENDSSPGPDPSDDDLSLLRLIRLREEPFATATDLVDKTSVGRKQTRNRLDDLVDKRYLNVEMVGTTKVYWLSDDGKRKLSESLDESS